MLNFQRLNIENSISWPAALCVAAICSYLLAPVAEAQDANAVGNRFFRTTITRNDKPLLAEAVFNDTAGNAIVMGAPLIRVISKAYGVPVFQIVDGPEWIHTAHLYDIEAVPPPAFIEADEDAMLQTLLADHFNLQITRSRRALTALVLQADQATLKLEPFRETGTNGFRLQRLSSTYDKPVYAMSFAMDYLASYLSVELEQPVLNETGMAGTYLVKLDRPNVNGTENARVLLEKTGLRTTSRPVEFDVLVISRIKHPDLAD